MNELLSKLFSKKDSDYYPFLLKTCELLEKEFEIEVIDCEAQEICENFKIYDISFLSTLTGAVETNMVFSFERKLSKKILDNFAYIEYEQTMLDEMIFETSSEFLNLVIGIAMKEIKNQRLHFTTPIALEGSSKLFCNKRFDINYVKLITKFGNMLIICSTKKGE